MITPPSCNGVHHYMMVVLSFVEIRFDVQELTMY